MQVTVTGQDQIDGAMLMSLDTATVGPAADAVAFLKRTPDEPAL